MVVGSLGLVVVVAGLLFTRSTTDVFWIARETLLVLLGAFLLVVWTVRFARREATIERIPVVAWAAVAVVVLMAASVITAGSTGVALWGAYERDNGFLLYAACFALFVTALAADFVTWRRLTTLFAAVALIVSGYGVLQWLNVDPISWRGSGLSTIFSTFGQTNFAAGWAAIAVPLTALVGLDRSRSSVERAIGAIALVLSATFILATASFQGVPAALVGLVPLAFVHRATLRSIASRHRAAAVAGVVLLVVIAGTSLAVPRARHYVSSNVSSGLYERKMIWRAGGSMIADSPIIGKGMGSFAAEFPSRRPTKHAEDFGYLTSDSAHSVPIELGVDGGVPLLGAYLALMVLVGSAALRGLRRQPSLLLGGLTGAWLAYLTQSLVSTDVPSLAIMNWLLAGGILAVSAGDKPFIRRMAPSPRTIDTSWYAPAAGACVVVVVAFWVLNPLRGDASSHAGDSALARRDGTTAVVDYKRAAKLAPWNGTHWASLANAYQLVSRADLALAAGRRAVAASPGAVRYRVAVAQLLVQLGKTNDANEVLRDAVRLDPHNPVLRRDADRILGRPLDGV